MINSQMRDYLYCIYTTELDDYGMETKEVQEGTIKMAINLVGNNLANNPLYKDVNYIGLTRDDIDDSYIIIIGDEEYKVTFVNDFGRMKQVSLSKVL